SIGRGPQARTSVLNTDAGRPSPCRCPAACCPRRTEIRLRLNLSYRYSTPSLPAMQLLRPTIKTHRYRRIQGEQMSAQARALEQTIEVDVRSAAPAAAR